MANISDACLTLPLSAGEDTFELFTVKQELEYVKKQIRGLLVKQAELLDRCSTLEASRGDAHKSVVSNVNSLTPTSSTPYVPLPRRTRSSRASFTPAPKQQHGPWITKRKTRDRTRAASPPLPVFEISTWNRFSPLRESAMSALLRVKVPEILNGDECVGAVVLHAGANDIRLRQTEVLKKDYRSLIETARSTAPKATIIVSGPLPTYRQGQESKIQCVFGVLSGGRAPSSEFCPNPEYSPQKAKEQRTAAGLKPPQRVPRLAGWHLEKGPGCLFREARDGGSLPGFTALVDCERGVVVVFLSRRFSRCIRCETKCSLK
ncbi:hypothetical protein F2P79_025129 [Pimephales promelas]|nr:hypothetical protein F2P79_025129 [Pimephales promelas]